MSVWPQVLELAIEHGWKPMGTSGSGSYVLNQGDRVLAKDARRLAAALERAFATLPVEDMLKVKLTRDGIPKKGMEVTLVDFFSGDEGRKLIRKCIRFFQKGAFEIW
jgi:hypothetical protein